MHRISKLLVLAGLGAGLLIPSLASAGTCSIVATDGVDPVEGLVLEARTADGTLLPVKTDEEGRATIKWKTEDGSISVFSSGVALGECSERLLLDTRNIRLQDAGPEREAPTQGKPAAGKAEDAVMAPRPASKSDCPDGCSDCPDGCPEGTVKGAAKGTGTAAPARKSGVKKAEGTLEDAKPAKKTVKGKKAKAQDAP